MSVLLAGPSGWGAEGPRCCELGPVQQASTHVLPTSPRVPAVFSPGPSEALGSWSRDQAAPGWTGSDVETAP